MNANQSNDTIQADDVNDSDGGFNDEATEKVLAYLVPIIEAIDPNWNVFVVGHSYAKFNGPKNGDVDIAEAALAAIPQDLMQRISPDGKSGVKYYNPAHQVQAIPERTCIYFENCEEGVVCRADGESFEVEMLGFEVFGMLCVNGPSETRSYTLEQLEHEFTLDTMCCQAVGVRYFPFLAEDGSRLTLADRRAAYVEATRKQEEEAQAREAEAERQRAAEEARYAALSPEEKQREDEAKRQKTECNALISRLLSPTLR